MTRAELAEIIERWRPEPPGSVGRMLRELEAIADILHRVPITLDTGRTPGLAESVAILVGAYLRIAAFDELRAKDPEAIRHFDRDSVSLCGADGLLELHPLAVTCERCCEMLLSALQRLREGL